ncbi:MAG: MATE family efflux transporter [Prochloraceae cyanobacterium]
MKATLTEGNISTQLFKLTLPMTWGIFALFSFNLIDTYFVGQLGTIELAAIAFTFPVTSILENIGFGLATGASSVISREIGKGDLIENKILTTNSLILGVSIVAFLVAIGLMTIEHLFEAMGATPDLLPSITKYMSIWYFGMIFFVVPMVANNAIRSTGNTLIPSIIITIAASINLVLDPFLIFGWGNFLGLGIIGAALATLIARAITMLLALSYLHFKANLLSFTIPKVKKIRQAWINILQISIPTALSLSIIPISMGFITNLIATYGNPAVAGFGIALRIENFIFVPIIALSMVIVVFVGQNWAALNYNRVRRCLLLSFSFSFSWGIIIALFFFFNGKEIAAIFNDNYDVINIANNYLILVPISYTLLGIIFLSNSSFNALGKPLISLTITLTRMLILYLPLAYLGSNILGINGIFIAFCLSNLIAGIVSIICNKKVLYLKEKL